MEEEAQSEAEGDINSIFPTQAPETESPGFASSSALFQLSGLGQAYFIWVSVSFSVKIVGTARAA